MARKKLILRTKKFNDKIYTFAYDFHRRDDAEDAWKELKQKGELARVTTYKNKLGKEHHPSTEIMYIVWRRRK